MNRKIKDSQPRRRASSVIVLGAAGFTLGCGLLVKDFLSIYSLAGRSSGFCESNCLSKEMATSQLHRAGTLRTIDIAVMTAGFAVVILGLVLFLRAQKHAGA